MCRFHCCRATVSSDTRTAWGWGFHWKAGSLRKAEASRVGGGALIAGLLGLVLTGCASTEYTDHEEFLNENEGRFTHTGAYIQLGYTQALEDFSLGGATGPGVGITSVDDASGVQFNFGYRGSRYVAVESGIHYLPGFDTNSTASGVSGFDATWVGLNTKIYPLGGLDGNAGRLQPYVTAGLGVLWMRADAAPDRGPFGSTSTSGTSDTEYAGAWRFGGGLELYLAEYLELYAEYAFVKPSASRLNDFDFQEATFGIGWRF